MKLSEYDSIMNFAEEHSSNCSRTVLADLVANYKGQYPHHTLFSIFLNRLQRKLKASYHTKTRKDNLKLYYTIFTRKMTESQRKQESNDRVLINIAIQFDLPPCLMSRLILDQYLLDEKRIYQSTETEKELITASSSHCSTPNVQSIGNSMLQMKLNTANGCSRVIDTKSSPIVCNQEGLGNGNEERGANLNIQTQTSTKSQVSILMKDPYLIPDVALRDQVLQCMSYDICYGPINDAIRHSVGLEFEEKLKEEVKKVNLPFLDENDLRKRGYDKTPDVKLEIPIAVCGHSVCWIESKASFGDLETHTEYLHSQYYSYWNRFGPGLVIYWFGFIEEISEDMLKQGILIMDGFPSSDNITFMNP